MKKLLLLSMLMFSTGILAQEVFQYATYYTYNTDTTKAVYTVSWDAVPQAAAYDIRVRHVEKDRVVKEKLNETALQYNFETYYEGHYIVEVRSKNKYGESPWASSTDQLHAKVDEENRAWWIYRYDN